MVAADPRDERGDPPVLAGRVGLWAALLLTAGIAVPRILATSMSIDEAYSMDTAGRSLAGTMHQAIHFELQPPLYFLLLNLWLRLWRSPEFARLLSLGCVLLALLMLHRLGRRLRGNLGAALLPLFAALTAPVAWSAITARGYALTLLLLACCCYGFSGVWWTDRPVMRRDLVLFVLAGSAAIYSFYYSGFAVAGLVVAAAISGRHRRELLLAITMLGVLVLPVLPTAWMQLAAHPAQAEAPVATTVTGPTITVLLFGGVFWTGMLRRAPGLLALTLGLAVFVVGHVRNARPRWSREESQWLLAASVPWGLLLALDRTGLTLVLPRHQIVYIPTLCILVAVVIDGIRAPGLRRFATATACMVAALFLVSYEVNLGGFDWRAAAAVICEREPSGEPVLIYTSDGVLAFRWEYRGSSRILGLPADPDLERYDPSDRYLRDPAQLRARVQDAVATGEIFWLIRRQWLPAAAGNAALDAYLAEATTELGHWPVSGLMVLRLRRMR